MAMQLVGRGIAPQYTEPIVFTTPVLESFNDPSAPQYLDVYEPSLWAQNLSLDSQTFRTKVGGGVTPEPPVLGSTVVRLGISSVNTEVYITCVTAPAGASELIALNVRTQLVSANNWTSFRCYIFGDGSWSMDYWNPFGGSATLTTGTSTALVNGDQIGLKAIGARLIFARRPSIGGAWILIGTVQSSLVTGPGTIGMESYSSVAVLNNFGGGGI